MAEAAPEAPAAKAGSGLKIALIIVVLILVGGVAVAWFMLKPTPPPVLESIIWPPGAEKPLQLTVTLSDGSFHVIADIRLKTVPVPVSSHSAGKEGEHGGGGGEFASEKSVILSIMTEVANSLDQNTVYKAKKFEENLLMELNKELKSTEIEKVLIESWLVQPVQ
jgi:flagellar basal body-associated protein FliL